MGDGVAVGVEAVVGLGVGCVVRVGVGSGAGFFSSTLIVAWPSIFTVAGCGVGDGVSFCLIVFKTEVGVGEGLIDGSGVSFLEMKRKDAIIKSVSIAVNTIAVKDFIPCL